MFRKWLLILLCLALAGSMAACGTQNEGEADTGKLQVVVTFNALKEFAQAVGGDKITVSTIVPDGTEAHDFEPKARDLEALSGADVFIYNGLGMDLWAEEAASAAANADMLEVEASAGADLIERESDEGEDHGAYDPHLWLGLTGARTEAENIKTAFVKADPDNQAYYEANYATFAQKLDSLLDEYTEKFNTVTRKNFVTGHAAFGYLCRDFGLSQNSVSDIFAEGEPSAQQLVQLVEYCRENNVTTIFAEELASTEVSQTLADEVGAKVETIYTIEGGEDGKSYLERMESNLEKIYASLE